MIVNKLAAERKKLLQIYEVIQFCDCKAKKVSTVSSTTSSSTSSFSSNIGSPSKPRKARFQPKESEEVKRAQRRHLAGASDERESFIRLRNSGSRFFGDTTSERRARQIQQEGFVTTKKYSSLIGFGRADMLSSGSQDNFLPLAPQGVSST